MVDTNNPMIRLSFLKLYQDAVADYDNNFNGVNDGRLQALTQVGKLLGYIDVNGEVI